MSNVSWKDIFGEFQWTNFESKLTSLKKSCTTTLAHYKARQVLWDLFSTNQGNGSKNQGTDTCQCGRSYENLYQKFENLDMIGWLDAADNVKASII